MNQRVVITGIGLLSPLGNTPSVFIDALIAGQSALIRPAALDLPVALGVVEFEVAAHFSKMQALTLDRVSQVALIASKQAVVDSGLAPRALATAGVYWGSGAGGLGTQEMTYQRIFEKQEKSISPTVIPTGMVHAPAAQISIQHGVRGECLTYSTACSSAAVAVGEAWLRIKTGHQRVAIAGGSECALWPGVISTWQALRVLCPVDAAGAPLACSPFGLGRQGFCLGEGGAAFILESLDHANARGAQIVAELVGYGLSNDAQHIVKPNPQGQAEAMRKALAVAALNPQQIDYINAHGTGTQAGDASECQALTAVFGSGENRRPLISGTKASHGHLLGASGALELAVVVQSLQKQQVPPTLGWRPGDPETAGWDFVPNHARTASLTYAMSNSFAFGGCNAVLVAKRWTI